MLWFGLGGRKKPAVHIIMDRDSHVLAKGELLGDPAGSFDLKIVEGQPERVERAEMIQVIPPDARDSVLLGRVRGRRGVLISAEPLRKLGSDVRRNFRMPVAFESYLYYPEGGREMILSQDLSSGGIAFFTDAELEKGFRYEMVIPVTSEPLIVKCEILRREERGNAPPRYGAKFAEIIDDEEALIREAVFSIQLESVRIAKQYDPKGRK